MPSTSAKQHRFMEMVAHDPAAAKRVGVPQSVGQDFAKADKGMHFAGKKRPQKPQHPEPDADERGGPSDADADDRKIPAAKGAALAQALRASVQP